MNEVEQQIPRSELFEETRKLLINRPRSMTLKDVSDATQLTIDFLARIVALKTNDPSVNKIEHLNKWLKANLS